MTWVVNVKVDGDPEIYVADPPYSSIASAFTKEMLPMTWPHGIGSSSGGDATPQFSGDGVLRSPKAKETEGGESPPPPTIPHQRVWDLLRQMRGHLLDEELISREEYTWLLSEAPNVSGGGSPAPRRLETYDEQAAKVESLSRELAEAQQQIATLTSTVTPELATELREWCASVWDGLLDRANLEDSERDSTIEQLAQIVEAHCQAVAVAYVQRAEQAEQQLAEARAEIEAFVRDCATAYGALHLSTPEILGVIERCSKAEVSVTRLEAENVCLREALTNALYALEHASACSNPPKSVAGKEPAGS